MGAHSNYYRIIEHLIILKDEFHRINKDRYKTLITELNRYDAYPYSDNGHLPDPRQLATNLEYSQSKTNQLLKGLLKELIHDFHLPPLQVRKYVHQFFIYIPWDEQRVFKNKEFLKEVKQKSISLEMEMPITPRIGEEIEIPFVQETGSFYRGYVHNIKHNIKGDTQEILICVHPWNNYFYQWVKMKEEYDRFKSRRNGVQCNSI